MKPLKNIKTVKENSGELRQKKVLKSGFFLRSLSTLVLIPIVLLFIWLGDPYIKLFLIGISLGVLYEWGRLCFDSYKPLPAKLLWFLGGVCYSLPAFWILWIISQSNPFFLMGLFIIIWTSDIAAYLIGKVVGGPKFVPTVSPNKTWSGAFGGFLCALGAGVILIFFFKWGVSGFFGPTSHLKFNLLIVILVAIFAQLGDLLESWVKRQFSLKDSGSVIPGHGGFLDRLDSLLAVGLLMYVLFFAFKAYYSYWI